MAGGMRVEGSETIEVFQLHGGAPQSVLRLPASAGPLHASTATQTSLETDGSKLDVTATAPAAAQNRGDGGVIAVRRPCDLSSALAKLPPGVHGATLTGLARPSVLVAAPVGAAAQVVPIPSPTEHDATLPALALEVAVDRPAAAAPPRSNLARTACFVASRPAIRRARAPAAPRVADVRA